MPLARPIQPDDLLTINGPSPIVRLEVDLIGEVFAMKAALARIGAALLPLLLLIVPIDRPYADDVLLTFGDMLRLRELRPEAAKRPLTEDELGLYESYEFYAYTTFEALQVANSAAELINRAPLFCAPTTTFQFDKDGDIARLADYVTDQLSGLTGESGGSLDRYDDQPASLVLLLGLRAAFPCDPDGHTNLAQR
jgi:hypothetical protein